MFNASLKRVRINNNPGNTEKSNGVLIYRDKISTKTASEILNAKNKSRNIGGSGININPSIKIKPSASSTSLFLFI
jgi:hypothetical protein